MSTGHILLLGAIAGATIFLGLPVGRVNTFGPIVRASLRAGRQTETVALRSAANQAGVNG